ncbi:MAG: hypothetical protein AAGJ40_07165 [Planctomycetota bacterium]
MTSPIESIEPTGSAGPSTKAVPDRQSMYRRRSRCCAWLFSGLALAVLVVLNLPYRYVPVARQWHGEMLSIEGSISAETVQSIYRAGWPSTYLITHHDLEHASPARRIAPTQSSTLRNAWNDLTGAPVTNGSGPRLLRVFWPGKLILNLIVLAMIVFIAWWMTLLRFRRVASATNQKRARGRWDGFAAAVCIAIPFILAAPSASIRYRQFRLQNRMLGQATFLTSVEVPEIIATRIPKVAYPLFSRLRLALFWRPEPSVAKQVASVSTLRALGCRGDATDWDWLDEIQELPELVTFIFERCQVPTEAHRRVATCKALRRIAFFGCKMNSDDIRCYDKLDRLEVVDLRRSNLRLDTLGEPEWRHSVRELYLPRPRGNLDDTLTLNGWTNLRQIFLQDFLVGTSQATVHLNLHSLPRFETLYLDRLQRHSLTASNLPAFQAVHDPADEFLLEMGGDDEILGHMWLETLDLDDVALSQMQFSARDLKTVRMKNLGRLRELTVSSFVFGSSGTKILDQCDQAMLSELIQEIGELPHLETLTLTGLPLDQVNLSPLKKLGELKSLNLTHAGLTVAQLDWIETVDSLESLVVSDVAVSTKQLHQWLDQLPHLKVLDADLADIQSLRHVGNNHLLEVRCSEFSNLRRVELTDLRRLTGRIRIASETECIRLVDLPRLDELLVMKRWPEHSEISGLTGLRRFAAGGPALGDDTMREVFLNRNLDELTLAYCSVSRDMLHRVGEMATLTSLALAGCGVDDKITRSWRPLERLRTVCFDDNQIGADTLAWLRTIPSLRRLSLARVSLDQAAWEQLGELRQLSDVGLIGVDLDPAQLRLLLSEATIERLNLSRSEISDQVAKVLLDAMGLQHLTMRDCDIEPSWLMNMLQTHPALTVDLGDRTEEAAESAPPELAHQFRLDRAGGGFGFIPPTRYDDRVRLRQNIARSSNRRLQLAGPPAPTLRDYLPSETMN